MATLNGLLSWVPWGVRDVIWGIGLVVAASLLVVSINYLLGPMDNLSITAFGLLEGSMLIAVLAFGLIKYRSNWQTLGLRFPQGTRSFLLVWLVLLASLVFTNIYAFIITLTGWNHFAPPAMPPSFIGEGLMKLLSLLVIALWGPFCEEVFFRGFILPALIPRAGVLGAVGISSLIFALGHGLVGIIIPVFVTGVLFAWLYLKTRSLWPCVAAHSLQNLLALSLMV